MFSNSSFDFQPRERKLSTFMSSRSKKRKANSDSELTLFESFERHSSYQDLRSPLFLPNPLHEYEDIDIMGCNSNDSNNLLGGNSVIDPSQMFIGSDSRDSSFDFACNEIIPDAINPQEFSTLTSDTEQIAANTNDNIPTMFSSSMFLENQTTSEEFHFSDDPNINSEMVDVLNTELMKTNNKAKRLTKKQKKQQQQQKPQVPRELKPKLTGMLTQSNVSHINQQWLYDKDKVIAHGGKWRNGPWSKAEEKILKENIERYCKRHGIEDVKKLIFFSQKDERKQFYKTIAKRLNRPLFAIYRKVLRLYDSTNHIGIYSEKDESKLKTTYSDNRNWLQIGLEIGRSAASVKDKVRLLKNKKKVGRWTEDELNALSKAVHGQTNTKKGENVTSNINWVKVSDEVGTRSEKQCRSQWLHHLNWKECGGDEWMKTDEIQLINRVIQSGASEEEYVDWKSIAQGWSSVRSPQWLRQKWWNIKKNYPRYQSCSFQELLCYLQTTYVQNVFKLASKKRRQQQYIRGEEEIDIQKSSLNTSRSVDNSNMNDTNASDNLNLPDVNRIFPSTNLSPVTLAPLQLLNVQLVSSALLNNIDFTKEYPTIQPTITEYKYILPNVGQLSSLPTNQSIFNPTITKDEKSTTNKSFGNMTLRQFSSLPTNQLNFNLGLKNEKPTTEKSFVSIALRQGIPSLPMVGDRTNDSSFSFMQSLLNDNSTLPKINTFAKDSSIG